jgi:hypothetical protein
MQPDPIRVIAICSLILGTFFITKSISIKTPKYVLHELLSFKVNRSRFFRKYISQRLDSFMGFSFCFFGFALLLYLEVQALGEKPGPSGFDNWWLVIGITIVAMLGIALLLSRIARFFSNKVFIENIRFMVETHNYPLEADEAFVLELGRVMRVRRDEEDTVESYAAKVRAKMRLPPAPGSARAARVPPRR